MNEKLRKEITEYVEKNERIFIDDAANYFYSLALEEVRKEVERDKNIFRDANNTERGHEYAKGRYHEADEIAYFINQLGK